MILGADQCIHCKTVHPLNVILMDMDAVLLVDGVGIHRLIVHVVVVLITEYKVNFEEKNSKTNLLYICSKIAMVNSYLSNTL